jgi:RNA polymerase sigma-70 factor (ECF subfamily)
MRELDAWRPTFLDRRANPAMSSREGNVATMPPSAWPEAVVGASSRLFNRDMADKLHDPEAAPPFTDLMAAVAEDQDRAAFAKLFAHFAPRIKAYVKCLGVEDHKAEDMVQEVMLTVWRRASLFDPGQASLAAWIFAIARNKRIDVFRRERRPQIDPDDPMLVPDPAPGADELWARGDFERRVRRALEALPEEQAVVVRKNFFEDKSHGVIAQELKVPLGTVKSRARVGVARLREALRGGN